MAETPNTAESHEVTNMGAKNDTEKLIENGTTLQNGSPESGNSYGEVSPLHLDSPSEKKNTGEGLKVIIISCIVFAVGVTVALIITIYCAPPQVAPHGAVSTDDERCSDIGVDLLKKGGSAVDSAIGTLFCLSVVQPESNGLGGGGFMTYRHHKQKVTATIDFRETAPQGAKPSDLDDPKLTDTSHIGGQFVGVPGFLKGMDAAYTKFGKLKWSEIIQPSIDLARKGYVVSENGAYHFKYTNCSKMDGYFSSVYCKNGTLPKAGDTIKLEKYSSLLEKIANDGISAMYEGSVAQEIVDVVTKNGGYITLDEMKSYAVVEGEPITSAFKNMSIETVDVPSGGPLLLFLLNVLDTYKLKPQDSNTSLYYHRFMEATKFSNALDEFLGDPAMNSDVTKNVNEVIKVDYAKKIAALINDNTTYPIEHYYTALGLKSVKQKSPTHTTHISVIGPKEDYVSITSSLNNNFGSKLVTKSGIFLNDVLLDFDKPSQPNSNPNNQMKAGARPQSHMAPTLVHSRNRPCGLRLATGAVGGWSITSEIAYSLTNLLAFNMTLDQSVEMPRIYYSALSKQFIYESGISPSIIDELKSKGHNMTSITKVESRSVVNSVMKVNETLSAHADSRRGGVAKVF